MGIPRPLKEQKNEIIGQVVNLITDIWIKTNLPIMRKHIHAKIRQNAGQNAGLHCEKLTKNYDMILPTWQSKHNLFLLFLTFAASNVML